MEKPDYSKYNYGWDYVTHDNGKQIRFYNLQEMIDMRDNLINKIQDIFHKIEISKNPNKIKSINDINEVSMYNEFYVEKHGHLTKVGREEYEKWERTQNEK